MSYLTVKNKLIRSLPSNDLWCRSTNAGSCILSESAMPIIHFKHLVVCFHGDLSRAVSIGRIFREWDVLDHIDGDSLHIISGIGMKQINNLLHANNVDLHDYSLTKEY